MSVVLQRQPAGGTLIGVFKRQLQLVLDVPARALTPPASGAARARAAAEPFGGGPAAEERREEIREGIRVAEHLLHFFLGHRAEAGAAAATADVRVPPGKRVGAAL